MGFEWDETKRQTTIIKHGIDFVLAAEIFERSHVRLDCRNDKEDRFMVVGVHDDKLVTVVFTVRGENIRLITARRARDNERRAYRQIHD